MKFKSFSPENTEKFAKEIGESAKSGEIFCLSGNLGAGKTAFAKGFAKGIGYKGHVTSPTFTIMNEYEGGRLPIYHFDLYRLEGGEADLESIGYEEYFFGNGVCLVEWPEIAFENKKYIWIKITADEQQGENYREIHIENFGN